MILGDGACGKTSLLNVFTRGDSRVSCHLSLRIIFTIFLSITSTSLISGILPVRKNSIDSDPFRTPIHTALCYVLVLLKDSLENVKNKWVGEITNNTEGVKLVLVALKCDLRNTEHENRQLHQIIYVNKVTETMVVA